LSIELDQPKTIGVEIKKWNLYPTYKDSGIEWLGEVPEGWEIKVLKRTFKTLNGSTPKSGEPDYWDGDIPWATPDDLGQLRGNTLRTTQRRITKEGYNSCGTSLASLGSLILSTRAPIGHLAIAGTDICTNQGCRCLVFCADDDSHYFYYQLLAARLELESFGQGSTFKELSRGSLESVYLTSPPIPEQRAIAAFLDRETGRIDMLIAKKERQIELLQEKRAALISHAVTKGLDPDVKMKDSGVEWLGEVPEEWDSKRLKYISSVNDETLSETTDSDFELLYVDISSIDPVSGIKNKELMTFENAPSRARRKVCCGDVIISTVRTYLRAISPINNPEPNMIVSTGFAVIRPKEGLYSQFAAYALRAPYFVDEVVANSVGVSYPAINASELITFNIVIPPLPEQSAIAAFLDRETGRIDTLVKKIQESISKLREYRTALISAAVTGKIDVRED
jgi:type I restriction enzyme S subunit